MKKIFTIVEYRDLQGPSPNWKGVTLEDEEGNRYLHAFSLDALEWRAAEYDIDPTEVGRLLDIILYEGYIPNPDNPENLETDVAFKAGMRSSMFAGRVPVTLMTADTIEEARTAHELRIEEVKETIVEIEVPEESSIRQQVQNEFLDYFEQDQIDKKKDRVAGLREQQRAKARKAMNRKTLNKKDRTRLDEPTRPS